MEMNWHDAPLEVVLMHYEEVSGKVVIRDQTVPALMIDLETGGKITEPEFLHLLEKVLELKGVHLRPRGNGTIRAYYQQPGT